MTLGDVPREAGVSQQTVVNHSGSKEDLYLVGIKERFVPRIIEIRESVTVGDVGSVVETVCADYEVRGAETMRALALADRSEMLASVVGGGANAHLSFVERALAPQFVAIGEPMRDRAIRLAAIALDVRTWSQLRATLSPKQTRADMAALVTAVLTEVGQRGEGE